MMTRAFIAASLMIGGIIAVTPVAYADVIGFTDSYAPGNWTQTLTGTPAGGGAPVGSTNDGSTLALTGGDSICTTGPCAIQYTIVIPATDHDLRFHWDYLTNDSLGGIFNFDTFGFVVNGILHQLSDDLGDAHQSGNLLVKLNTGDTFGWYLDCFDCDFGNAVGTITNFTAGAPEPGSLALLGLAFAGLAGWRRRYA